MRVTSILDLLGLLLLVAGVAVFASKFGLWAGLVAAGVGVLGASWLIDRRAKR